MTIIFFLKATQLADQHLVLDSSPHFPNLSVDKMKAMQQTHLAFHLQHIILLRPVVELPVQLSGVQVLDERQQHAGLIHVLDIREQVHVSEAVNGDQR